MTRVSDWAYNAYWFVFTAIATGVHAAVFAGTLGEVHATLSAAILGMALGWSSVAIHTYIHLREAP